MLILYSLSLAECLLFDRSSKHGAEQVSIVDAVVAFLRGEGLPVALTLGGGYADPVEASVSAYAGTYRVARALEDGIDGATP